MEYVYHPYYVDAIVLRNDSSDNKHYYLQDANFNVTAVTNGSGEVKERYTYTPYGEATILNGANDADGSEWIVDTNGSDMDNE